jgi:hypothetical protein
MRTLSRDSLHRSLHHLHKLGFVELYNVVVFAAVVVAVFIVVVRFLVSFLLTDTFIEKNIRLKKKKKTRE